VPAEHPARNVAHAAQDSQVAGMSQDARSCPDSRRRDRLGDELHFGTVKQNFVIGDDKSELSCCSYTRRNFFLVGILPGIVFTVRYCLQCFDTVGWASGRASGYYKLSDEMLAWLSDICLKQRASDLSS